MGDERSMIFFGKCVVDFSGFDLLEAVRTAGIRVICLDECHHLRSEWWAALEHFMHEMENAGVKVISLTDNTAL